MEVQWHEGWGCVLCPDRRAHTVITRYWRPPAAIDFNGEYSDMKLLAPAEVEIMKVR